MECLICGTAAEPIPPAISDAKGVRCADCGDYEVSGSAEAVLARWNPYARLVALRYAQTNAEAGRRPYLHGLA